MLVCVQKNEMYKLYTTVFTVVFILLKCKSTLPPAHLVLSVGAGEEATKLIFNSPPLPLA